MTSHPFAEPDEDETIEDLAEGGTWLLDVVAAVDHLRRGYRPEFTVWDALTEALDWNLPPGDTTDHAADPLADRLKSVVQRPRTSAAAELQRALRHWVTATAHTYNNGLHWPHPTSRRGFPPPMIDIGQ